MSNSDDTLNVVELVVRKNLRNVKIDDDNTVEALIEKLSGLTHVRLDRENLTTVPLLDFLPYLTNLYLQCNNITKMTNLSALSSLKFLTLAENKISRVEGIKDLTNLGLLDLSDNVIENLDVEQFPSSLMILNLNGNNCINDSDHVESICSKLENLTYLNDNKIQSNLSSEEEDEDDEEEVNEGTKTTQDEKFDIDEPPNKHNFYEELATDITSSLREFSLAISHGEIGLREDFEYFTSIPESPVPDADSLSEKEICKLEKDAKIAHARLPSIPNSAKKISPRPPSGGKIGNRSSRNRSASTKESPKPIARVRTPGARPFKRVVNM